MKEVHQRTKTDDPNVFDRRILDGGYAAIRSAFVDGGSSRRIDSLAVPNPRISACQSSPNPDSGLRSSMKKTHVTRNNLLRKKGNWSCPHLTGHSISATENFCFRLAKRRHHHRQHQQQTAYCFFHVS